VRHLLRQATAWVVALALLVSTSACHDQTPPASVAGPSLVPGVHTFVQSVTFKDGQVVTFDKPGGRIANGRVSGSVKQEARDLDLADVERGVVFERTFNTWKTIGLTVAILAAVVLVGGLIVAATKQSCPFVYSWDGQRYVFDAEPYGGAVTRGLERSDDVALEHLVADGGVYRLLMTNEVLETQRTNHVALRVVDHAPGVRIVPDGNGKLHALRAPRKPASARLAGGRDLLPWLEASDERVFEPQPTVAPDGGTRDEIVLTFPRPEHPEAARLVVNAGTSLAGSFMIREGLALRGRELPDWYRAMDTDREARAVLEEWIGREELWRLKLDVLEADGWQTRGTLIGTGPLVIKDRVVPLDLSRATGPEVAIRIRPPRGFWAINSFALDDGPEPALEIRDVPLARAVSDSGVDRTAVLSASDDVYDTIAIGGEAVRLSFDAPPVREGMDRTVFLHAGGYYTLDLAAQGEPDRARLEKLETEPGYAVRLAVERWATRLASLRTAGAR
jgi:hypothetical protein